MKNKIYLDNAATTPLDDRVLEVMLPYFTEKYGNPSSVYTFGNEARRAVDEARKQAARLIGARLDEIYFTSGGSESDNWALKAVSDAFSDKGKHIITSKIEHHAVINTCKYLEKHGYEITYLDVDKYGRINLEDVKSAIRPDTILISIMSANNEIGTIEPISGIGRIAHENGVLFHTDAVQAYGHIDIDVNEMNIDLLSASGHKFNGPKGTGIMYIRKDIKIGSLIHGGAQERSRRAGTLNVPGIVGFGKAAEIAGDALHERMETEKKVRDYFIERVLNEIPYATLNGDRTDRLPNNANFSFEFVDGESVLILLDQMGIYVSSGSACSSGSLDPSHVLTSIGLTDDLARGTLRFTLSEKTTVSEIDTVVEELKKIIEKLRNMSPVYKQYRK